MRNFEKNNSYKLPSAGAIDHLNGMSSLNALIEKNKPFMNSHFTTRKVLDNKLLENESFYKSDNLSSFGYANSTMKNQTETQTSNFKIKNLSRSVLSSAKASELPSPRINLSNKKINQTCFVVGPNVRKA